MQPTWRRWGQYSHWITSNFFQLQFIKLTYLLGTHDCPLSPSVSTCRHHTYVNVQMIIKDWNWNCMKQWDENQRMFMRIGLFKVVYIKITALWDAMPCQLVASYQHLRGTYYLHLLGTKVRQQLPLQHRCQHYRNKGHYIPDTINFTIIIVMIIKIVYLTAKRLSLGGSGYNTCTRIWNKDLRNLSQEGYMRSMQ
jgi:hypothetical protein